jgi:hypothetical protein
MPVQVSGVQLRQRRIGPVHDGRENNDHIRVRFYCTTGVTPIRGEKYLNEP